MPKTTTVQDAFRAIRQYAIAYKKLEEIQRAGLLPIGDQKTGVIAEFYAQIYAERIYPRVKTGHSSQSAWDLMVSATKTGKIAETDGQLHREAGRRAVMIAQLMQKRQ